MSNWTSISFYFIKPNTTAWSFRENPSNSCWSNNVILIWILRESITIYKWKSIAMYWSLTNIITYFNLISRIDLIIASIARYRLIRSSFNCSNHQIMMEFEISNFKSSCEISSSMIKHIFTYFDISNIFNVQTIRFAVMNWTFYNFVGLSDQIF